MAESTNQAIADALTARQLQVQRAERHQRDALWAMLALLEAEIIAALKVADPFEIPLLARRRRAVEDLLADELEPLITTRYDRMDASTTAFLVALALQEVEAVQRRVNAVTAEETLEETPPAGIVRRAVTETLIPTPSTPTDLSATGSAWWERQGAGLVQRIGDQLMVAASLDETVTQATARLRGTSAQGFQDGIMAKAREDAARLLTTQTTNAIGEARVALADANPDAGMVLEHHSVLDSHTCLAAQTDVRTSTGPRAISLLEPGDRVYGGSGQIREVLACHRTPVYRLVRVTLSDGSIILCTPDHQFLTSDFGWLEARQLKENITLRTETML